MTPPTQAELDFFGPAYARAQDPVTSHKAAEFMQGEQAASLEKLIYSLVKAAWPGGLTMPEMSKMTGEKRDTLSPRSRSLVEQGLIHNSGEERINPESGCMCIIWKQGPDMRMTREQLHALGWKPDGKGGVISVAGGTTEVRPIDQPQIRIPPQRVPNRTEQRWLHDHQCEFATGHDFRYTSITFILPSGTRYTPDWSVWRENSLIACVEVKGGYIHNSASIRAFKEAVASWRWISWEFAQWKDGKWHRTSA